MEDLVDLELRNQITDSDYQQLLADKIGWRDCLIKKMNSVERQLIDRKGQVDEDIDSYLQWRKRTVGFKHIVVERLRKVKELIKQDNVARSAADNLERNKLYSFITQELSQEIKEIKEILYDIQDRMNER
ncbi:MAG: hypothetical protein ACXVCY_04405 [Pseudobdellovibrionaceae bacterium]